MNALISLLGLIAAVIFAPVIFVVGGAMFLGFWETYGETVKIVGALVGLVALFSWAIHDEKKKAARKAEKLEEAQASE